MAGAGYQNVLLIKDQINVMGPGVRAGFGYEFARHYSVEAILQHGFHDSGHPNTSRPTSFGVTMNVIWY